MNQRIGELQNNPMSLKQSVLHIKSMSHPRFALPHIDTSYLEIVVLNIHTNLKTIETLSSILSPRRRNTPKRNYESRKYSSPVFLYES